MNLGTTFFGSGRSFSNLTDIGNLVKFFLDAVIVIAGIVVLFFFILGGIGMISSAGKNDPQKSEQAKKTITSAVVGFIVVITSYWIVKLITSLLFVTTEGVF